MSLFKTSPMFDVVEIVRTDGTIEGQKCWICCGPMVDDECPKCGPACGLGPSEEEERETWRRR